MSSSKANKERMASGTFNRFSLLKDMADSTKNQNKKDAVSPPVKRNKKKTPLNSDSSGNKVNTKDSNGSLPGDSKNKRKSNSSSRLGNKNGQVKPRRLLMEDSDSDDKENAKSPELNAELAPTPPDVVSTTCPATNYYVKLAREHHHIPDLEELLDKAGSFGRMFDEGNPVNSLATDIVNINDIYGMRRPRYQERKRQWEIKSSLVFYEQGIILQLFEREKIVLFFELVKKHKNRIPNLYRLYNSVYDLEKSDATQ